MNQNMISWAVFAAFVACAVGLSWHPALLDFSGGLGAAKAVVWLVWGLFVVYSIHCSVHENIFRSLGSMSQLYWGRQVGIDLYLGIGLSLSVIYLNEGSLAVLGLWLVPMLLFANLATLLYVATHFESLVGRFTS